MSNETKFDDSELHAGIEKKAQFAKKKQEIQEKELTVKERRLDGELERLAESDKDSELAKSINYGAMSEAEIEKKQQENTEYMMAAKNKMSFVNKLFNEAIPLFQKNLILIGGATGDGKSTTVANIIRQILQEVNPITKKIRRVLVLTNEERTEDVYNRITCLAHGWHYVNHDKFSERQIETFNRYIKLLSRNGMLTVIDNTYGGARGTTSTLEGICQVFDNLIANKEYYDVVIIDYYQNVNESRKNPTMSPYEVQAALANRLDQYKNIYPAPIIVMAQVDPYNKETRIPFKYRIQGRKIILNMSTCAIEMVPNKEELTTEWHIHKSRFNEAIGQKIITGYDRGRYVVRDDKFSEMVERMKAGRDKAMADSKVKMEAPKEEKKDE